MKKQYVWVRFFLIVFILLFGFLIFLYFTVDKTEERRKISVIVDENAADRYQVLKMGMNQAAADFDVEISVVTTVNSLDAQEQANAVSREMRSEADGIIIDAVNSEKMADTIDLAAQKKKIILLETQLNSPNMYTCIESDNYKIGQDIGNELKKRAKEQVLKVGILSGKENKNSNQQRLQGLQDAVAAYENIEIVWEIPESVFAIEDMLDMYMSDKPVDILVALENMATEDAGLYKEGTVTEFSVWGVGNTEQVICQLDSGIIEYLIVPDEYKMGYLCVMAMVEEMQAIGKTMEGYVFVEHDIVTKENLYEEENQKKLFRSVQ